MEDRGSHGNRNAGFGSTDGQWHHIGVTWQSSTGIATLYLDGRKVTPVLCNNNNHNNDAFQRDKSCLSKAVPYVLPHSQLHPSSSRLLAILPLMSN